MTPDLIISGAALVVATSGAALGVRGLVLARRSGKSAGHAWDAAERLTAALTTSELDVVRAERVAGLLWRLFFASTGPVPALTDVDRGAWEAGALYARRHHPDALTDLTAELDELETLLAPGPADRLLERSGFAPEQGGPTVVVELNTDPLDVDDPEPWNIAPEGDQCHYMCWYDLVSPPPCQRHAGHRGLHRAVSPQGKWRWTW